jgi:triosephosphate isomerase
MAMEVLVAGNFKANSVDATSWLIEFERQVDISSKGVVVVCPAFGELHDWQEALSGSTVALGSQDISAFPTGPHTGEVTGEMLKSFGVTYVIIGHSERRTEQLETNEIVAQKIAKAFEAEFVPIVCIGENLKQRKDGETKMVLEKQLKDSLVGLSADQLMKVVVAYEPLWAIGTGEAATKENAEEAAAFIKETARVDTVLYGGSVKPENVATFIAQPNIDGVLVGGASLKGDEFGKLAKNALTQG